MEPLESPNDSLVQSYLALRKAIGTIGMLLPFVLVLGTMILGESRILPSISDYYYSIMGDVFVASLCAVGVFLWSYRGPDHVDDLAGDIASVSAIGVALFPTTPVGATATQELVGHVHFFFAFVFFSTLTFFALVLFRKMSSAKPPTERKLLRNSVYTVCGYAIAGCIVLIVFVMWLPTDSPIHNLNPVFWLESVAVLAFGISWFVKGEAILKDMTSAQDISLSAASPVSVNMDTVHVTAEKH